MADPTPEEKLAQANQEIERLSGELVKARVDGKQTDAEPEDLTPTPTQAEIDNIKAGATVDAGKAATYKTRQAKA